jgi:hypothetical protein
MPPTLAELKFQHADAMARVRRSLREQGGGSTNQPYRNTHNSMEGLRASVLDERLDLDDTSSSAFLPQLQNRLRTSREEALFAYRP